jgi:predicted phosphate transport protein (TIGR00153 family)
MTFPREAEDSIRRRILKICQDHARIVVELNRKLVLMFESVVDGRRNEVKKNHDELFKLTEEFDEIKKMLLAEVATVGALLINREDFLRLIFKLSEMADSIEGVAFRLLNCPCEGEQKKSLAGASKISSLVLEETSKMRETMLSLSFNPEKAMEMALAVEKIERDVDSNYRNLTEEILNSKMEVHSLLVMKDIIERLETIADLNVDTIDLIRLLAISG